MNLSEMIRGIRRKSLLSQSEFAKEIGVSFSTVNRWENNKVIPNYQTLKRIRDFCENNGYAFEIDEILLEDKK